MNREQLEHALRAAGAISGDRELYVVGNPNTNGFRGLCLDPGDLAVSKLAAGRPKDIAYLNTLLRERIVTVEVLEQRLAAVSSLTPKERGELRGRVQILQRPK